ncbi:hypothetical protein P43SY_010284 [Pythium insidiosum]|uniref:Cation efflux protein transmembrane domain-containing protein n=1 Tax=Pythium insidiosum TaxID=114742 RepID=A0AAD5L526_PYTIN|nr:hypothetical protein P43SY_010284 [Pythium insidiosum]
MNLATAPHFHLLSLLTACGIALPLSWLVAPRTIASSRRNSADAQPSDSLSWMASALLIAALQLTALYVQPSDSDAAEFPTSLSSSSSAFGRRHWLSLMICTITGLAGSLLISAMEDDWLRFTADLVAAGVIICAQFLEMLSVSSASDHATTQQDRRHVADPSRVLSVLWAKPDSRKILLFLSVNVSYMFIELLVGIWSNSLGLIGDAGHMFFDNGALFIGLVASYISALPADAQFTYGYGRVEPPHRRGLLAVL